MNNREAIVKKELESDGWTVQRVGWPDFLCHRGCGAEVKAVEVKAFDDLSEEQENALYILGRFFNTEVRYVSKNYPPKIVRVDNYSSPPIKVQMSKIKAFEGLGVS